jgi:hypothetical protein
VKPIQAISAQGDIMKSRTLTALAVAGTFACGGAFAGGMHGKHHSSMHGSGVEVATPSAVNESAPWLANQMHSAGWSTQSSTSTVLTMDDSLHSHSFVGASSDLGGSGSGGFDSMSMSNSGFDSSLPGLDYSLSGVDYWLWGDEIYGTGTSSGIGGSGSGGFDSMSSFGAEQSFDMISADDGFGPTEQYLVWGPLSEADADDLVLVEADVDSLSPLTLSALTEGYSLLTPIYDEVADASSFDSDSTYQLSQYSPLSGDEDIAT